MTQTLYPNIRKMKDPEKTMNLVIENLQEINRLRETEDIGDFENLPNRFIRGRRVERIPGAADSVLATDELGDISNDSLYVYQLLEQNDSIGLRWNRITADFSW